MPRRKYTVLKPVHPNAGIEAEYRAKLLRLVRDMQDNYVYYLSAQFNATPPEMALDATSREREMDRRARQRVATHAARKSASQSGLPARNLKETLDWLQRRWTKRMDDAARKLARWFTLETNKRSQDGLKKILKDGGISVEFKMTAPMRDVLEATLAENVSLIKSIGSQYHTEIEGMVMRSVTAGRDLQSLNKELKERYGVTERRANFIALDQNNKATSSFVRVRQQDLGLKAKWLHSHGGKEPRPTHLANDGNVYDPAVGWFDPDPKVRKRIWPGQLPRCRCVSVSVVPGFSLD
jgi:uncharacterized protein with gpF-like domain